MTGWCDEVKQNVYTVVTESWVTLDPGLFGKNVIVLAFEISDNF